MSKELNAHTGASRRRTGRRRLSILPIPRVGAWRLVSPRWVKLCGLMLALGWLPPATLGQSSKVAGVEIKHVGPPAVSDALVHGNIRIKPGDTYFPAAVDDDVRNLYATGLFYNIRVAASNAPSGLVLTYLVQGNPRLSDIRFQGNKKFKDAKLRKTISSKNGEPFSERKLFTDTQELQKLYQKKGYPRTTVKYTFSLEEATGRATATFEIHESPKVKIIEIDFAGAQAFPQKRLRKVLKTRKHWMFSWLTGSGYLKDEQFEDDKEKLIEFYRDHGYLDFEIKDVQFVNPSARTMVIRFNVSEGTQYKVGSIKFSGNKLFSTPDITNGLHQVAAFRRWKYKLGPNALPMDVGDVFTPKGLGTNIDAVEDFYGARGYIDVTTSSSSRNLNVVRIPNTDTGTMDLDFQINEGQKSYVEKIEIRGNTKTKDKVIRRELAVTPGEVFDMTRVKLSKQRLEGLQYFEKVDTRPEPTDVPSRKNLIIGVDEKSTGNLTVGAGFSSIDALVGFVEYSQGNFDLVHPPTFTGGGQKFRLRLAVGTQQQDYLASFIEPWFLGRKLQLSVDVFYRDLSYESLNSLYDVVRGGGRVGLTRALGSDFLIGNISYTLEDVGIRLTSSAMEAQAVPIAGSGRDHNNFYGLPGNLPQAIRNEVGYHLLSRLGSWIAYDTRNSVQLPDKGQRTALSGEFVGGPLGGDKEFYKLDFTSSWYFRGLVKGHVLEIVGRAGVAESLQSGDVPFYERYYLGGLYSLRGFKYHSISPREPGIDEPIGGDTYWFGSAEYSIPIIDRLRFAVFYDIGNVAARSYDFKFSDFDDNWGLGLRLNLPIGPLRLDYGIPIHHDKYNSSSGQFQFGVGYTRELR